MAVGNRILMNVCIVLAESERISSMSGAGTAESPVAVATTIGKKQIRNTTTIFGNMPNPSQSRSRGAIATLGTEWDADRNRQPEAQQSLIEGDERMAYELVSPLRERERDRARCREEPARDIKPAHQQFPQRHQSEECQRRPEDRPG